MNSVAARASRDGSFKSFVAEGDSSRYSRTASSFIRANKLLVVFAILAVVVRLVFWIYTNRTWEDALITLTVAQNVYDGFGLTHHASEPRVQSFTSPLGLLFALMGEAVGQGLFAVKLASLLACIPTLYYAYRIGERLRFHWSAQVLVLGYLATDQLQIFFGMGGMETQIATAIVLANAYYYLTSQWWKLGVAVGLGLLCRPEFVFWVPILGLALLLFHREAILSVAVAAGVVALPWFLFAFLYFGTIIPHTIVAKSFSFTIGFLSAGWEGVSNYALGMWKSFAPFKQFYFTAKAPLPDELLKVIVAVVTALAIVGVARAFVREPRLIAIAAFLLAFLIYRTGSTLSPYFMWYLPPFMALAFVLAGYGLSAIALYVPHLAGALGATLAFAYGMHIPFSFPLDRTMQVEIDEAVRIKTGEKLNELMQPGDTVVLEPLGYIGWVARNKTIYDFSGLGSKVSVEALKSLPPSLWAFIDKLKPNWIVLRPGEFKDLQHSFPKTAALYAPAAHIEARADIVRWRWGLMYDMGADREFVIFKRS